MRGPILIDRHAIPSECSASRPQQSAEDSEQARLARAVGSHERERTAPLQVKRDPGEDRALAADAGHVVRLQAGAARGAVRDSGEVCGLAGPGILHPSPVEPRSSGRMPSLSAARAQRQEAERVRPRDATRHRMARGGSTLIALGQDTLRTRRTLSVGGRSYDYFSLPAAAEAGLGDIARLPFSLKVLDGEPAPLRGWPQRQRRRHPRGRGLAGSGARHRRNRLPSGARA